MCLLRNIRIACHHISPSLYIINIYELRARQIVVRANQSEKEKVCVLSIFLKGLERIFC